MLTSHEEEQELYIALLDEDSFTEYKRLYGGPAGDARRWALNVSLDLVRKSFFNTRKDWDGNGRSNIKSAIVLTMDKNFDILNLVRLQSNKTVSLQLVRRNISWLNTQSGKIVDCEGKF